MKKSILLLLAIMSMFILSACGNPKTIEGKIIGVDKGKNSFIASIYGMPRGGYINTIEFGNDGDYAILHSDDELFSNGDIIVAHIDKQLFKGTIMHPVKKEKTKIIGYSFFKYDFIHDEPTKKETLVSSIKNKFFN